MNEIIRSVSQEVESKNQSVDVRLILLEKITISEFCARDSENDDLTSLMESIRQIGLINPPTVIVNADGTFELLCGRRRFLAFKNLGCIHIPCIVRQSDEKDLIFIALAENIHRLDATPVDQARFFKRAQDKYGYTEDQMAVQSQLPQSTISERLSIIELGDDILATVSQDSKSPFKYTHAVALAQLKGTKRRGRESEVRSLMQKTICHRLTTIELKMLVKLITDGGYDRLPDSLRMLLFSNKFMTAGMASLYLAAESLFDAATEQYYRNIALNLDRKKLEKLICRAVKSELSVDEVKQQIITFVKGQVKYPSSSSDDFSAHIQQLTSDFAKLADHVEINKVQMVEIAQENPQQLEYFRHAARYLLRQVQNLMEQIDDNNQATVAVENGEN